MSEKTAIYGRHLTKLGRSMLHVQTWLAGI